jgi:nitrite reductase/ring-hydroxylating ferredoxin subunit
MKRKLENRREFLKKVCPTIAFAFFGLSFLEACSTGDDSDNDDSGGNNQNGGSNNNDNPLGYTSSGSVFTIDLNHPNFSNLSSVGGWMNGYSIGLSMLFLRISSDHIQAYTNVCPHAGTQNQWSLQSGNIFKCANHNYSFDSTCETSNSLPCFSTNIEGGNLIVAT